MPSHSIPYFSCLRSYPLILIQQNVQVRQNQFTSFHNSLQICGLRCRHNTMTERLIHPPENCVEGKELGRYVAKGSWRIVACFVQFPSYIPKGNEVSDAKTKTHDENCLNGQNMRYEDASERANSYDWGQGVVAYICSRALCGIRQFDATRADS